MAKQLHFGIVTRNVDTDSGSGLRGAVYFESESLTGGVEYSEPAQPCFPFAGKNKGMFFVPSPGDVIQVEVDPDNPEAPGARYQCGVYSVEDDIDDLFKENYPNRMGWVSTSGHFFVFDDTTGEEFVQLGHALGTKLKIDFDGSWLETIIRDKVEEVLKNHTQEIGGQQNIAVQKDRLVEVRGATDTHITRGDFVHEVQGNYTLKVNGVFRPEVNAQEGKPEQIDDEAKGFRKVTTGGGYTHNVGGSKTESIVSNNEQTICGTDRKFVAFDTDHVYGTGYNATVGLGNAKWLLTLGNYIAQVIAGNIELTTLAGTAKIGNALGSVEVDIAGSPVISNLLGGMITIDPLGNVLIDGSVGVFLGGAGLGDIATGGVITFANNPVVDNITGAPHIPSFKVISK